MIDTGDLALFFSLLPYVCAGVYGIYYLFRKVNQFVISEYRSVHDTMGHLNGLNRDIQDMNHNVNGLQSELCRLNDNVDRFTRKQSDKNLLSAIPEYFKMGKEFGTMIGEIFNILMPSTETKTENPCQFTCPSEYQYPCPPGYRYPYPCPPESRYPSPSMRPYSFNRPTDSDSDDDSVCRCRVVPAKEPSTKTVRFDLDQTEFPLNSIMSHLNNPDNLFMKSFNSIDDKLETNLKLPLNNPEIMKLINSMNDSEIVKRAIPVVTDPTKMVVFFKKYMKFLMSLYSDSNSELSKGLYAIIDDLNHPEQINKLFPNYLEFMISIFSNPDSEIVKGLNAIIDDMDSARPTETSDNKIIDSTGLLNPSEIDNPFAGNSPVFSNPIQTLNSDNDSDSNGTNDSNVTSDSLQIVD
jgi:hypothetical protein